MVTEIPAAGSDILSDDGFLTTGGGFNAMSAAARQGMSVVYGGKLGTGPLSTVARKALGDEGISELIPADEHLDAGFCIVMVDATGERTFVTVRGAEEQLNSSDLVQLSPVSGDVVLVSGYNVMYPGSAEMVLDWLEDLRPDVMVAFDPSNRVYDIPDVYLDRMCALTDWMLCNEVEAQHLIGGDTRVSANGLSSRTRGGNAILRLGARGCSVAEHNGSPTGIDPFITEVRDTNGAGDIHNGIFLAELVRSGDANDAARRANAGAAIAISRLGPATCPIREEINGLLA